MRLILAALVLAGQTCAAFQQTGSAAAMVTDARAAMRAGRADRDIAAMIDQATLTEQLEDAVMEQLQTEGAGPEAMDALDRQREWSRNLAKPSQPLKLFDAPAAPSAKEQSR